MILRGTVVNLKSYGAFVDLGGIDGLIHISELSWGYVKHPHEVLNVGDKVDVYVLKVD
jgi:ribosomal protein S1